MEISTVVNLFDEYHAHLTIVYYADFLRSTLDFQVLPSELTIYFKRDNTQFILFSTRFLPKMVWQLTISFHTNTYIIFLRDVISSWHPMKKEKFCRCCNCKKQKTKKKEERKRKKEKKVDCELEACYRYWKISKIVTKVYHNESNKRKTFTSWESLNVLLSWV